MPNYTPYYTYTEPQYGEYADINEINQGVTAKVDENIYQTRRMMVDGYDSTQTYNTGDLVEYSNALYKCLADNVTGTWDSTKWELTTLADSAGGSSDLSDLDDVDITTPADGDILIYDDTDDEWKNAPMPDASVTKSVTGNPVEFTDGADAPLVKCVTEIQGSQDLHGQDKPWPPGAGKNKLHMTLAEIKANNTSGTWSGNAYTVNGITFTVIMDGSGNITEITATGTSTTQANFNVGTTPTDGSYILNGCPSGGSDLTYMLYVNTIYRFDYGSGTTVNLTGTSYSTNIVIRGAYTITGQLSFKPMIRLSTETDSTFAPYSNICHITAYDENTISAAGSVNLVLGVIAECNIDATGVLQYNTDYDMYYARVRRGVTYSINIPVVGGFFTSYPTFGSVSYNSERMINAPSPLVSPIDGFICFRVASGVTNGMIVEGETMPSYVAPNITEHTTTFPSAIYRGSEDCVNGEVTTEWGMIASYAGETLPGEWISDRDEYAPGTTPTTGAQVAYELSTSTTTSVTPTNLPIKSLSGYNHIESNTGELDVTYLTDTYQPLIDLSNEASVLKYSTDEQKIGKWIDGSDLYEKTYTRDITSPGSTYTEDIDVSGLNIVEIIKHYAHYLYNGTWYYLVGDSLYDLSGQYLHLQYKGEQQGLLALSANLGAVTEIKLCFTIRYTKTSSNNRSVSLSKGETSESEEKTEELPEEEEKAVEKSIEEPVEEKEEPIEEPKEEKEEVTR